MHNFAYSSVFLSIWGSGGNVILKNVARHTAIKKRALKIS
ncbi:hypothetical protein HMPREF1608_02768 [Escherichia coli 908525]|nr:hypothetical protein ECFDA504_0018 [Escherichia coli FDA504]EKJ20866.1 hypothetical protein ECEC1866_5489 [Escherichia coli EC1866]ESD71189.1 hypothetical protein HMPREF1608_02768 [Escherichia coli 908525]